MLLSMTVFFTVDSLFEKDRPMIVTKETDLGTISVSNVVFAEIISGSIHSLGMEHTVWPSSDRGKPADKGSWTSASDTAKLIDVDYIDEKHVALEFSIIIRFGASISGVTRELTEAIREALRESLGLDASRITINIAGVRSRKIARRNSKVVYDYAAD